MPVKILPLPDTLAVEQRAEHVTIRVSKESIFSGLNNIDVDTLLDRPMCTAFGFTQVDVDTLLDSYSLGDQKSEVKHWYNGYLFSPLKIDSLLTRRIPVITPRKIDVLSLKTIDIKLRMKTIIRS